MNRIPCLFHKLPVDRAIMLALAVLSEAHQRTNKAPVEVTLALRACLAFVVAAAGGGEKARQHAISFWFFVTGRKKSASGTAYQDTCDRYTGANACLDLLIRELGWEPTSEFRLRQRAFYEGVSWPWKTHAPTGEPLPEWLTWETDAERRRSSEKSGILTRRIAASKPIAVWQLQQGSARKRTFTPS